MEKDPFKEYIITEKPSKEEKQYAWKTGIKEFIVRRRKRI